jgi:tight adherence protein B
MTVVAASMAAVAVWLAFRPAPGPVSRSGAPGVPRWPGWCLLAVVAWLGLGAAAVLVVLLAWGTRTLLGVRGRRRRAAATAARVLEVCEQLAGDLAAGRPPEAALTAAADTWPVLAPVARAGAFGGDVPGALRDLAGRPGAGELRLVAAAWTVSQRTGAGLAAALDRVAGSIRADRATQRVVEGELASARATARLVAALPLLVQLLGVGGGGSPWRFLLHTPLGLACLAGGLALGFAGLWWIERIADGVA